MMIKLKSKISYALYFLLALVFFTSCNNEKTNIKKIGIVLNAEVVPTSFNEAQKIQIKTKDKFFVVYGLPQINIGDTLLVEIKGKAILKIKDARGKWFRVL